MQTVTLLSLLGALGAANAQSTVLGAYIFSRHGGKRSTESGFWHEDPDNFDKIALPRQQPQQT